MAHLEFSPLERQLLTIAADNAIAVSKSAEGACKKAYLTEAEDEAQTQRGYAEEAKRFLNAPEGTEGNTVQLAFGHRAALRVGCFIAIADCEKIAADQEELVVESSGVSATRDREESFRKLEQRLRMLSTEQREMPLDTPNAAEDAKAEEAEREPIEAEGITPHLALMSGEAVPDDAEHEDEESIPDAEVEDAGTDEEDSMLVDGDDADADAADDGDDEDFALADDDDLWPEPTSDDDETADAPGASAGAPESE